MTVRAHGLVGVADAGAFLARVTRLEPGALVRLRGTAQRTALWARLPWDVLVTRTVAGAGPPDATVSAADLLRHLAGGDPSLPPVRDEQWRWALPPSGPAATAVESVAVAEFARLAQAAAGTLRAAAAQGVAGRAVGQRQLRDALLDHVALVVQPPVGEPVSVPQRLVQAVVRMGFLGAASSIADGDAAVASVLTAGRWLGISAPYGTCWLQTVKTLTVVPISGDPNG
ncbi:MAG TPA: hypothetical protein VFO77_10425 [Actinoplanes sp.]|nr:hypothetical protein [Actinoplanes sp.]